MSRDPESTLARELRLLAGAEGDRFTLEHDGVSIDITYSGGSSSSLTMRARYDEAATEDPHELPPAGHGGYRDVMPRARPISAIRPLGVKLRPERHDDIVAKREGISVEAQTGDDAFDRGVYVDTPAPADVVVAVLRPDVRAAVLDLFALGYREVELDDDAGYVRATIVQFTVLEPQEDTGRRSADAFARLAKGLPRVHRLVGAYPRHPLDALANGLTVLGFLLFVAGTTIFPIWASGSCDGDCGPPVVAGVATGLVAAVVAAVAASAHARRFAGRSDSHRVAWKFAASVFFVTWDVVGLVVACALATARAP